MSFLWGRPIFRGHGSFRKGIYLKKLVRLKNSANAGRKGSYLVEVTHAPDPLTLVDKQWIVHAHE